LGQYIGDDPVTFRISGNYLNRKRTFRFAFKFDKADRKNGFVPRLWASRKIAVLIDAVRQLGADGTVSADNPRVKELTDEIVRLSTEFGILTEYTAFLAREGTDLSDNVAVRHETATVLERRAMRSRSGYGGVNQSFNLGAQKAQTRLNMRNDYYDEQMNRVSVTSVRQVNDRAYYRRGSRWVDSRLVENESDHAGKAHVIEFATKEYFELLEKLAEEHQQASVALEGDILLMVDNRAVLVRNAR